MKNKKFNLFLVISFLAINILVANSNKSPFELNSVDDQKSDYQIELNSVDDQESDYQKRFSLPNSLAEEVARTLPGEKALKIAATLAAFTRNLQVVPPLIPPFVPMLPQTSVSEGPRRYPWLLQSKTQEERNPFLGNVLALPQHSSLMPQNLTIPLILPPLPGQSYEVLEQPYQNAFLLKNEKVCPTCGKKFPSASKLERHQTVHTNERPFACKQCHKRYTQKGTLDAHVLKAHPQPVEKSDN